MPTQIIKYNVIITITITFKKEEIMLLPFYNNFFELFSERFYHIM